MNNCRFILILWRKLSLSTWNIIMKVIRDICLLNLHWLTFGKSIMTMLPLFYCNRRVLLMIPWNKCTWARSKEGETYTPNNHIYTKHIYDILVDSMPYQTQERLTIPVKDESMWCSKYRNFLRTKKLQTKIQYKFCNDLFVRILVLWLHKAYTNMIK